MTVNSIEIKPDVEAIAEWRQIGEVTEAINIH
jgi:hypothetical protein